MRKILITIILASAAFAGCDKQRDLYDVSVPMLDIEGKWGISLGEYNMLDATAIFYKDGKMTKEFLSRPNHVTAKVSRGQYEVLLFNGVMESEQATNLNHIFFRGTDRPETFKAVAVEGKPNSRFSRSEDEYIASNEMEIFTFAYNSLVVEGDNMYYLKYKNGRNGYPILENYVESKVELVPRAVSYRFQVKITNLVNPRSARSASGALRGFAGSVFIALPPDKMPRAGSYATHHLNLTSPSNNKLRASGEGKEIGTIQSPVFVSFGPPLPENLDQLEHSGKYMFEPSFMLADNSEFTLPQPIDITEQVNAIIKRIFRHHAGEGDITIGENLFTIEITDPIVLPVITPEKVVDVMDWGDDEEIIVWIKP